MAFVLGDLTHSVNEIQRLFEVREAKSTVEMMFVDDRPSRDFPLQRLEFFALEGRNASAAGDALLVG